MLGPEERLRHACILRLGIVGLFVLSASGQNINYNFSTVAQDDAGFKPPYPIRCRAIDYDTWSSFSTELAGGAGATTRCQNLYNNPGEQPEAASEESLKICEESFQEYMEYTANPDGTQGMFCDIATLEPQSKKVRMNQYLVSKLSSSATEADHDLYRQFQRWVDDTNLKLIDDFATGVYGGAEPQQLSHECIQAFGAFLCTQTFPNCTYMLDARWPYNNLEEHIYPCKETCQDVLATCRTHWLPYRIDCDPYVSKQKYENAIQAIRDFNIPRLEECQRFGLSSCEGVLEETAYNIREYGGHACASTKLTKPYTASAVSKSVGLGSLLTLLLIWKFGYD